MTCYLTVLIVSIIEDFGRVRNRIVEESERDPGGRIYVSASNLQIRVVWCRHAKHMISCYGGQEQNLVKRKEDRRIRRDSRFFFVHIVKTKMQKQKKYVKMEKINWLLTGKLLWYLLQSIAFSESIAIDL